MRARYASTSAAGVILPFLIWYAASAIVSSVGSATASGRGATQASARNVASGAIVGVLYFTDVAASAAVGPQASWPSAAAAVTAIERARKVRRARPLSR